MIVVNASKIRKLRQRRMLTQQALGRQVGLSVGTVNRIEQGHQSPRFASIEKIATALGVEADTLFRVQ